MENTSAQRLLSANFPSPQSMSVPELSLSTLMANNVHQRDPSSSQFFSQLMASQTRTSLQRASSLTSTTGVAPLQRASSFTSTTGVAPHSTIASSPSTPLSDASRFSSNRLSFATRQSNQYGAFSPADSIIPSSNGLQSFLSARGLQNGSTASASVSSSTPLRRSRRLARTEDVPYDEVDPSPATSLPRKRKPAISPKKTSRKRQKVLKEPPSSSPHSLDDLDKKPSAVESTCTICLCEPDKEEVSALDGCNHLFCFSCIEKWSERENSCPLCKCRFSRITRMNPLRRRKGTSTRNTKKVKTRDQRADMPTSAAIEGLLASLAQGSAFPGSARLGRMFATQLSVPVVRSRTSRANASSTSGRFGVTMIHPSMNLEDDEDTSLLGFMQAVLRSHREGHHGDIPGELHVFPSGESVFSSFGVPSSSSFVRTARSHASNENDVSAGRAPDNPLEIDDSDDEVELIHIS